MPVAIALGGVRPLVLDRDVDVPGGRHPGHLSAVPSEARRAGEPAEDGRVGTRREPRDPHAGNT